MLFKAVALAFESKKIGFLSIGFGLAIFVSYSYIFFRSFTLYNFFEFYTANYGFLSWLLIFIQAALFGLTFALILFQARSKGIQSPVYISNPFFALFLGLFSADCPRCSSFFAGLSGQGAASFAVFPWHGLEAKLSAIFLLAMAIFVLSRDIIGEKEKVKSLKKVWAPFIAGLLIFLFTALLPDIVKGESRLSILKNTESAPASCVFK